MQGVLGGFLFYTGNKEKTRRNKMSAQVITQSPRTAKPAVGGAISIFAGACSLVCALGLWVAIAAVNFWVVEEVPVNVGYILTIIAIPVAIAGILAIIGGILSIQRKAWGWALAGSIASIFPSFYLGIASVVLIAMSRNEFSE
jgi:hypothetical protein